mgnify:CR=1 FL=1
MSFFCIWIVSGRDRRRSVLEGAGTADYIIGRHCSELGDSVGETDHGQSSAVVRRRHDYVFDVWRMGYS